MGNGYYGITKAGRVKDIGVTPGSNLNGLCFPLRYYISL